VSNVYSVSEIVGSSPDSIDSAIRSALARMSKTVKNLDWFVVSEIRGQVADDGGVACYQVALKVGFRVED
jgi:dodecin